MVVFTASPARRLVFHFNSFDQLCHMSYRGRACPQSQHPSPRLTRGGMQGMADARTLLGTDTLSSSLSHSHILSTAH